MALLSQIQWLTHEPLTFIFQKTILSPEIVSFKKNKNIKRKYMGTGKFIVLYGINNLGKTCQAERLVEFFKKKGFESEYLKYPIYDLEPTGPIINRYLRKNNPDNLSLREVQILYTTNRIQYAPILLNKLNSGIWIVAEDYVGTGLAWGGQENLGFLKELNNCLFPEDIPILFDGERFVSGIEENHKHENDDKKVLETRENFSQLAIENSWYVINANQTEEKVFEEVKNVFKKERLI